MKSMKMRGIAAAVTGALLFGFGANAMADSSVDIVNALVAKGVLTEEEGALITKGAKEEKAANAKAIKKAGKLSVSDAIDNAKIYGDIRVRYERRDADNASNGTNWDNNRARSKIAFGVETNAGDWYSDLAFTMSDNGRSDNATFGKESMPGGKNEFALYMKRAMIGYKATDWLSLEAGRMKNPLYMVNAMVFDHDIVMQGFNEKANYKLNDNTKLFANLGQWVYQGELVGSNNGGTTTTARQNMVLAFQGGVDQTFSDKLNGKVAVGYYNYTANSNGVTNYLPITANNNVTYVNQGVNSLGILDIPAELNFMATSNIGVRPYAEYAYNTLGSDRRNDAILVASGAAKTALQAAGKDDNAWLVGVTIGSAADLKSFTSKKMSKGDWSANLWYQSVGIYALDPNAVDSDIFDGRLNMEGTTFKAQYNIQDNVALNFTGAYATRKNDQYASMPAAKTDIGSSAGAGSNIKNLTLFQFDLTYKF